MKKLATLILFLLPFVLIAQSNTERYVFKFNAVNKYLVMYSSSKWEVYPLVTGTWCPTACATAPLVFSSTNRVQCMTYCYNQCGYPIVNGLRPHYWGIYTPIGSFLYYCINNVSSGFMTNYSDTEPCPTFCGPRRTGASMYENQRDETVIVPNPSHGIFYLTNNIKSTIVKVLVYDITGKLVKEYSEIKAENSLVKVDMTVQPKGIYFIKINLADGTSKNEKLILE